MSYNGQANLNIPASATESVAVDVSEWGRYCAYISGTFVATIQLQISHVQLICQLFVFVSLLGVNRP